VQTDGPPDRPLILFDYTISRAQEVPVRLLDGYRGSCWAHARREFVEAQIVQPKGKTGGQTSH